jgi:hypothetical protein
MARKSRRRNEPNRRGRAATKPPTPPPKPVKPRHQEKMVVENPTIFVLDEALEGLKWIDPINVRLTRMQLKWLIKASRKHGNIRLGNPYGK